MNFGIFTDIHFQPKGLDRIIKTGDWIIEEFKRQDIKAVICMGDALVTREEVDVVAQSAAIHFFRRLADIWPVFLTLGNHDLNLKHSAKVSSLDGLDMHPKIKVFREITLVGDRYLFIPYYEDQGKIVQWVQDYVRQNPEKAKNITVFGHFGLNGAVTNTRYNTAYAGAIGPDLFEPFARTYVGHFHVHQRMANRVTFVGSPTQFNFGDSGDERGIMVLDPDTGADRFVLNPHHDAFKVIAAKDLVAPSDEMVRSLRDCFVTVIYDDIVTDDQHEAVRQRLESAGVIEVKRESVVEKAIREHTVEIEASEAADASALVEPFVKAVLTPDSQLDPKILTAFGKAIIAEVNASYQDVSKTGTIFQGDIVEIVITKFLGVNDTIRIKVSDLAKGIWYLEGPNGHGKSTLLEAIFWCYYGEFIRSDMKADDAVFDPHETGKTKDCEVTVLHANGWGITRFRKNAKLGGTGVKVYKDGIYREDFEKGDPKATQKAIDDLLGINAPNFMRSIIMGQNITANFVSGDEKKRRTMIEEMLGLERFDAYLEKTREHKKAINDTLEQQEQIQRIRAGEIERSAGQVSQIDQQILAAEKQHQETLDKLGQKQVDWQAHVRRRRVEIVNAIDAAEKVAKEAHDAWQAAVDEHQFVGGEQSLIKGKADEVQTRIDLHNGSISRIASAEKLRNATLQAIDTEENTTKTAISAAEARIAALQAAVAKEPEIAQARAEAQTLRDQANTLDQSAAGLRATRDSLATQANPLSAKAERLSKLESGECPTCSQPVDKAGLAAIVAGLNTEVVNLRAKWKELNAQAEQEAESAAALRAKADQKVAGLPTMEQILAARTMIGDQNNLIHHYKTTLTAFATRRQAAAAAMDKAVNTETPGLSDPVAAVEAINREIQARQAEKATILASYDAAKVQALSTALEAAEKRSIEANRAVTTLCEQRSAIEAENTATERALEGEVARLQATDPSLALKTTRERLVGDRAKALAEMEAAKIQAQQLSQKAAYVTFWDRAFAAKGSMRAFLLEQSVNALNMVVQGFISQHFGGRLTLTLNSDLTYRERYGRRSGGQRKWTDLASLFSLFELSRQRSRYRSSFLCLDEVFDALDAAGRQAVLDLIAGLVTRVDRIFVITHVAVPGSSRAGTIQAHMPDIDTGTTLTVRPT